MPQETEEEYLNRMIEENKFCRFSEGCKQRISVLGHDCKFCMQRYCQKHALPEVHGCGEICGKQAR